MQKETSLYEYDTQQVITLAYAAYRINNGYVKETRRYSEDRSTTWSNKELIRLSLSTNHAYMPEDFCPLVVTDQDKESAAEIDNHFKRYTMHILGDTLSDFQKDIFAAISVEKTPINKIGLIAYVPELINREVKDIQYKRLLKSEYSDSQLITSNLTDSEVVILKVIDLQKYNTTLYVGGIGNNLVSFTTNAAPLRVNQTYKINAKIKSHGKERESGYNMTQLNYVKVKKENQ